MKKLFLSIIFLVLCGQASAGASPSPKVEIFYFYSSHCGVCLKLGKEFLSEIAEKYKDKIVVEKLNIDKPENLERLLALVTRYRLDGGATPSLFIGDDFLVGKIEIEEKLEFLIHKYSGKELFLSFPSSSVGIIETFKSISFLTILSAGLIDGINPCAFAVIVFFISFLSVYGYNRKEILYIGIFYVLSVFITYVLIGLGLFTFFYSMKQFYFLMKFFYYFVSGVCFLLAGLSLYDYVKYKRTGSSEEFVLRLPRVLKKKVNLVIGAGLRKRKYTRIIELCLISFSVGFVVSLLEAACTGQVYLPTVMYIIKVPGLRVKAVFYLIFYNLMFVLPLVIIFILSLAGIRSQQFNEALKKNIGWIKLIMTGLFVVLGALILVIS